MLSLEEIKRTYPENLRSFDRFILREYLQYKILEIIFETSFRNQLVFLGGTCLRIVYGNRRFSEDLDFDNFELSKSDFDELTVILKRQLEKLGLQVEMRNVKKGAFHCYLRFPEILQKEGLTNHKTVKILIQLDTEPHNFQYTPDTPLLNKFDVFTQIKVCPPDLLLAQKFYAVINRKRNKGRDFFDIVFLLGKDITPNYEYLNFKLGIDTSEGLRKLVLEKCSRIDMREMAEDVKPFLFNPEDDKRILLFVEYITRVNLG